MYIEIDTKVLIPNCDGKVENNLTNRSKKTFRTNIVRFFLEKRDKRIITNIYSFIYKLSFLLFPHLF